MTWLQKLYLLPVVFYRRFISPMLGATCRFHPTCSAYFIEAVQKKGIVRGTLKGLWRILRCNPFCKGGYDPVDDEQKTG